MFGLILHSCSSDNLEDLEETFAICDTTVVTFSADIQPLIQNSCQGCHNTSNPSGSIDLEGYSKVKVLVDNGGLLGSIRHESGWTAMPKGGNKWDDCSILKLEVWVNAGAQDN